mmetsp:Transcript_0/g.3  ORF Transcript_0/g.3 Transcript_0/m.3 type:complete len:226 (-) Transcript_0:154-831(-)
MAQHRSSTSVVTIATMPHTIHASTMPRDSTTMNRMSRRHHPMKAAAKTTNESANIAPAAATIKEPAASSCASIWSCAFSMASSTVSSASSISSMVPATSPRAMDSSVAAVLMASAMARPLSTRSSTVSTMACVRSETPSSSAGPSEKIMKHPAAVSATKTRITTLLITRSFLVNLRGLYAPLQHLQHSAPQMVLAMYTRIMRIITTMRMIAMAKPGMAWPTSDRR